MWDLFFLYLVFYIGIQCGNIENYEWILELGKNQV